MMQMLSLLLVGAITREREFLRISKKLFIGTARQPSKVMRLLSLFLGYIMIMKQSLRIKIMSKLFIGIAKLPNRVILVLSII